MARKKKKTPQGRKPTYGAATRLARLVHELRERPNGWSFEAIQEELRITERTLARYLEACRRELVDHKERPLLEVVRRGERRYVRLAENASSPASTDYEVLALFFTLNLVLFMFNLLPIHPLDGGKVFSWAFGAKWAPVDEFLGRYGGIVILVLVLSPIPILGYLLGPVLDLGQRAFAAVL